MFHIQCYLFIRNMMPAKIQNQISKYLAKQAYTRLGKIEEEGFAFSYLNPFLIKSEIT